MNNNRKNKNVSYFTYPKDCTQCKNYPEVNAWIDEIITSLLDIGLDIRVFVSDLGSDFISASKSRSVSRDKTYFEVNGHKIY